MEMLLRTLITGQKFWTENPEIMDVSVDVYTEQEEIEVEISIEQRANYETLKVTNELLKDAQLLANHFRLPSKSNVDIQLNPYFEEWASRRAANFELEVSRPTAHEQLEAQFRWREWKAQRES